MRAKRRYSKAILIAPGVATEQWLQLAGFDEISSRNRYMYYPIVRKKRNVFLYCLIVATLDETPHPVKF